MPENWVEKIKKDENRSLTLLYKTHREEVVTWIQLNYKLPIDVSCDIFQSSIIQIYENVTSNKLTHINGTIKSYLYGICRYKTLEHLRSSKIKSIPTEHYKGIDQLPCLDNNEMSIDTEMHNKIKKNLNTLGEPCKQLLELYYSEQMSLIEIAKQLDYKNSNTVKTKKYKCLQRLSQLF